MITNGSRTIHYLYRIHKNQVKTAADLPQVVQEHECKGVVIPAADMGSAKEARDKCTHDPIVVGGSFFDGGFIGRGFPFNALTLKTTIFGTTDSAGS